MFVYCITNTVNDKVYIGQHSGDDLDKYFTRCAQRAMCGSDTKPHLYNAIRKHGIGSFVIKSLVNPIDKAQMDALEIFFIRTFETQDTDVGYNIMSGGSGGMLGRKASPSTLAKMCASRKGRPKSKEWAQKIGDSQRNRVFTEEHIKNLKAGQIGKPKSPRSPEHCKKISENKKLWWAQKNGGLNGSTTH